MTQADDTTLVRYVVEGPRATITLDSQHNRNALEPAARHRAGRRARGGGGRSRGPRGGDHRRRTGVLLGRRPGRGDERGHGGRRAPDRRAPAAHRHHVQTRRHPRARAGPRRRDRDRGRLRHRHRARRGHLRADGGEARPGRGDHLADGPRPHEPARRGPDHPGRRGVHRRRRRGVRAGHRGGAGHRPRRADGRGVRAAGHREHLRDCASPRRSSTATWSPASTPTARRWRC